MAYQQPGGYAQPGGAPQWGAVPGGAQMAGYGAASGGYGAPQPGPAYGAPQGAYGAPDPQLAAYFRAVDRDGSGRISAMELSQALSNGHWQPFNPETISAMIRMFDKTNTGEIVFNDFAALWAFVNAWQAAFVRFDTDRSGNISTGELESCIRSLGYNLSPHFFTLVVPKFSKPGTRSIYFDDFVLLMITVKQLTDVFRQYDTGHTGHIQCAYEQFLAMCIQATR